MQACGTGTKQGTEKPEIECELSESMEECNFFYELLLKFYLGYIFALSRKYTKNMLDKYQLY